MTILDISKWQGAIGTAAFASMKSVGVTRVIHKAGGSNSGRYTDSKYVQNVAAARAAGMGIGHYWFNGAGDPTVDADYFVSHLTGYNPGDWLVLDVESETSPYWTPDKVMAFATRVYARTGRKVVVYMSSSVTKAQDWSRVVAYGCPLWVAQYSNSTPTVGHWPGWIAWQYTSSGVVPGYGGRVDLSREGTGVSPAGSGSPVVVPASGHNASSYSTKAIQAKVGATADGIYGYGTTTAVKKWQAANGLVADGIVGPKTAAAMFGKQTAPAPSAKPATTVKLAVDGSWGAVTTKALQKALGVPADGTLGPQTYKALQKRVGVAQDGVYGPATKKALQKRLRVPQDGVVGPNTVKALQSRLNDGSF